MNGYIEKFQILVLKEKLCLHFAVGVCSLRSRYGIRSRRKLEVSSSFTGKSFLIYMTRTHYFQFQNSVLFARTGSKGPRRASGTQFCACLSLTVGETYLAYGGRGGVLPDPADIGKIRFGFMQSRTQTARHVFYLTVATFLTHFATKN